MVDAPRDEAIKDFPTVAAIDSCSVWNVLSSPTLTNAVKAKGHHFILAEYVRYECLVKRRRLTSAMGAELQQRLNRELRSNRHFSVSPVTVDDLRALAGNLNKVKRFHLGEFAALALARKLGNGFLTDDRAARMVGEAVLGILRVRTTPHLVGWLVYSRHLVDGDIQTIIADNSAFHGAWGRLGDFIQKCYEHAMLLLLRENLPPENTAI